MDRNPDLWTELQGAVRMLGSNTEDEEKPGRKRSPLEIWEDEDILHLGMPSFVSKGVSSGGISERGVSSASGRRVVGLMSLLAWRNVQMSMVIEQICQFFCYVRPSVHVHS